MKSEIVLYCECCDEMFGCEQEDGKVFACAQCYFYKEYKCELLLPMLCKKENRGRCICCI